jgi:hypothetical protein
VYNEVSLTASIPVCEYDISYEWSDGSTTQNIVVTTQTETYSVIITCGVCIYTAYYNTNGCLVGLACNDGLDCTENDEVQENCECEGTPILDMDITFITEEVHEELCSQEVCLSDLSLSDNFYFQEFIVELPSGEIFKLNKGLNSEGFDFPYCLTYSGTYLPTPIAACEELPPMSQLIADINAWLGGNGTASIAIGTSIIDIDTPLDYCIYSIQIINSSISFINYSGYTDLIPSAVYNFTEGDPCEQGDLIGINVTVVYECPIDPNNTDAIEVITWSNGDQGESTYVATANNNICLEVSVTCASGCTYTAEYGDENCNCELGAFGTPCDDDDICTINDAVTIDCDCVGDLLADSDYDGICDLLDECPGADDSVDLDEDGIPDFCDPVVDCGALGVTILSATSSEVLTYCTFLNDPIFKLPALDEDELPVEGQEYLLEELWLDAFVYNGAFGPVVIDNSIEGFNFPYIIKKGSDTPIPDVFFTDMVAYLGSDITFGTSTEENNDIDACIPKIQTIEEDGTITYTDDPIPGVLIHASAIAPIIPISLQFSWGDDNNIVSKPFAYFGNTNNQFPITLSTSVDADCGNSLTYLWSTGETTSSINIASPSGTYTVTVTCGTCDETAVYNPNGCQVGDPCEITDVCDIKHFGTIDPFCNCLVLDDIIIEDTDGDGIPDDCDDCDPEFTQEGSDGGQVCCENPPSLIYSDQPVEQTVNNFCIKFSESLVENLSFYMEDGTWIFLDESKNFDEGLGSSVGNFFHFPYCTENNCEYFGEDLDNSNLDVPYNLKNIKSLAYDLAKWASFNGYKMKPSTFQNDNNCECTPEEGKYFFYIDEAEIDIEKNVSFKTSNGTKNFVGCKDIIDGGYTVKFDDYNGCNVTSIIINHYNNGVYSEIEDIGVDLDLSEYLFGPVPHMGVGFRATITCSTGCVYVIETPDADCIVGDTCDIPYPCAETSFIGYDDEDCRCLTEGNNDDDQDGVCNDDDECEGYDDNLDFDGDGIPDGCDTECDMNICDYTIDVSFNGLDCSIIHNIEMLTPDDTETSKYFISPAGKTFYEIGHDDVCEDNESAKLIFDLTKWFIDNNYRYDKIEVDGSILTISGTNVEFVSAVNGNKTKVLFEKECLPPFCGYSVSKNMLLEYSNCIVLEDIFIEVDGSTTSLSEIYPEFSFPYCFNDSWKACGAFCNSFFDMKDDFKTILGLDIEIDSEGDGSNWFLVEFNIPPSTLVFTQAKFTSGEEEFKIGDCIFQCDDGWPCTINDQFDENCNCIGTFVDSDNDSVCDAEDVCKGYPDYMDTNNDGTPDGCETTITIPCYDIVNGEEVQTDIPFCQYLNNILHTDNDNIGKIQMNNLIAVQEMIKEKFDNIDNPLDYLPFPELFYQIENNIDCDGDGIANILDPCPCTKAIFNNSSEPPHRWGTHENNDCILDNCENNKCEECKGEYKEAYLKERHMLLNTFLFTVIEGTNYNTEGSLTTTCADDTEFLSENGIVLDPNDVNDNGYIFDTESGCYVYFDIDCEGNCLVNFATDLSGNSECEDVEIVGEICTTSLAYTSEEVDENGETVIVSDPGYFYVQCPPAPPEGDDPYDVCDLWEIVANPEYDPDNPEGADPCVCQQQMNANGGPATAQDSDGDGVCDILDQCAPAVDEDGNMILNPAEPGYIPFQDDENDNGVPDCLEGCADNLEEFIKEGYAIPTGPGDVCDDHDACTYDDVITENCACLGVYIDSDDDGVYDCEECELGPGVIQTVPLVINGVVQEDEDGNTIMVEKEFFGFGQTTVFVDYIGNETDPGADDARKLINCDVCPGIPDGDPLDIGGQYEGDLPMDYNDNGLPDCIDPPFKPLCPYDFEISADGLGLILRFDTDEMDEEDYPEPISFQGLSEGDGEIIYHDYLTVDFAREVVIEEEDENGDSFEKTITEVYYTIPYTQFESGEFDQATIIYSDHQTCVITNSDIVPLPCPKAVSIIAGKITFEQSDLGAFDLNELIGNYTIISGDEQFTFSPNIENGFEITINTVKVKVNPELISAFSDPFSGTIILPSGLECEFFVNSEGESEPEVCNVTIDNVNIELTIGTPCDDYDECTHHDKWNANCECEGEDKPDTDSDGFCDAIDPCPEDPNEMPTVDITGEGEINHLDINDCPCPDLLISSNAEDNPSLENGGDFVLYLEGDLSEYTSITFKVDDLSNPTISGDLSISNPIIIPNLTPGFNYTIQIEAFCGQNVAGSLTYEVFVPFSDNPIICGVEMEKVDLTSLALLASLSNGEEFQAANFTVKVKGVEGVYGKFSGSGYVSVPYFNLARLNVKFDNVTISADRQLVDGFVYATGIGLAVLGDDLSDAINGELDGIINTLEDASVLIDKVISMLETMEQYLNSVKDLVTEENLECYLLKRGILEGLVAQYEADNTSVTAGQLQAATADLKDCFQGANEDAIAAVAELMILIEYSFVQFNTTCPSVDELEDDLSNIGYGIDDSKAIIDDLFSEFSTLTTPNIEPSQSSEISGIEFSKGIDSDSEFANSTLFDNPLVSSYYKTEKELFLCNVSKLIVTDGIFDKSGTSYNQESAENMLNTIIIAVTNAGANMAQEFAPELLTGVSAEDIFNEGDNSEKIKEMISQALANEVYK